MKQALPDLPTPASSSIAHRESRPVFAQFDTILTNYLQEVPKFSSGHLKTILEIPVASGPETHETSWNIYIRGICGGFLYTKTTFSNFFAEKQYRSFDAVLYGHAESHAPRLKAVSKTRPRQSCNSSRSVSARSRFFSDGRQVGRNSGLRDPDLGSAARFTFRKS